MNYTVAPAHPQHDRATLLRLWSQNLPEASPERHRWLYADGPALGWLASTSEGQPIGATGLMHRTMKVFNETTLAGQAIDLNVNVEHRSVGPALALQRAVTANVQRGSLRLLYAFPNSHSEPILRRVGYREFGQLQRWAKPLRSDPFLATRLRSGLLRKPIATGIDTVLWLQSRELRTAHPKGTHFERLESFDARFDALWRAAAPRFAVVGERTAAYLDWRWHQSPEMKHDVLALCDTDERLLAYVVFSRHGKTVYVDDFLFLRPHHLTCVLAELLRQARRERANAVVTTYLGSPEVEAILESFGFWRRPGRWNALVCVDPQHPLREESRFYNASGWHVTRADLDTDFYGSGDEETPINSRSEASEALPA